MSDFAGATVVVTGAAGGLGRALCRGFHAGGARVVGLDRVAAEGESQAAGGGERYVVDIADWAAIRDVALRVGPVDVLVNNAATADFGHAVSLDESAWSRVLAVNLSGALGCCQAFGAGMIARRRGRIVNVASPSGLLGVPFVVAYNASKMGLIGLTRTLGVEWAPHNVQVNAVVPGFIRTPLSQPELDDPARLAMHLRRIPSGRVAEPEDIVDPILFLASAAARHITGQTLVVDGGMMAAGGAGRDFYEDGLARIAAMADA